MVAVNVAVLAGNVTRDLEMRYLPSGKAVVDIGLAVNEKYKDQNGQMVENVSFFDVTVFGKTAELASQYLRKGSPVLFEGRLRQERWNDKQTGQARTRIKLIAERMQFLGSSQGQSGGGATNAQYSHGAPGGNGNGAQPGKYSQPQYAAPPASAYSGPSQPQQAPQQPPDDEIPF